MAIITANVMHSLTIAITTFFQSLIPISREAFRRIKLQIFGRLWKRQVSYANVIRSRKVMDNASTISNSSMAWRIWKLNFNGGKTRRNHQDRTDERQKPWYHGKRSPYDAIRVNFSLMIDSRGGRRERRHAYSSKFRTKTAFRVVFHAQKIVSFTHHPPSQVERKF